MKRTYAEVLASPAPPQTHILHIQPIHRPITPELPPLDPELLYGKMTIIHENNIELYYYNDCDHCGDCGDCDYCDGEDHYFNNDISEHSFYYDLKSIQNIIDKYGKYIIYYNCYHVHKDSRIYNDMNVIVSDIDCRNTIFDIFRRGFKKNIIVPKNFVSVDFTVKYIHYED